MRYLLDTNVLSETRRLRPEPRVLAWFESVEPNDLYVSVLSLGELAKGIALRRRKDPRAAASLEHWRKGIETLFADRLIPIGPEVASAWGEISAIRPLPVIDSLLAASARVHDLVLVTRNTRDMANSGVRLLDPWELDDPNRVGA